MTIQAPLLKNKTNYLIIFILTLVHFTGDFYSSFFTPLIPAFIEKLNLSLAQVGLLTGATRLLAFIVQPAVGYMADRYQTRTFVLTGLFMALFFIPFSGASPSYLILFLVLCLGSLGSSMFHPATTGMVPLYAGRRSGLSLSIFNTGGTLAFALGPVFITWYVEAFGLGKMPYTIALGVIVFAFCLRYLPVPVSENLSHLGFIGSMRVMLGDVYKSIFLIWVVMVIRAVASQSYMTFMPVYLNHQGHNLVSVGFIVSLFTLAGTLSGLLSGWLSDKMEFKKLFFFFHLLMTPALLLFLYLPGPYVYLGSLLAGFMALASLPLGVGMAQKLAPKSRSMVSSLMMGFAYGLGGAISPLVGKLADIFGIETVLLYTALTPMISLIFIYKFPKLR